MVSLTTCYLARACLCVGEHVGVFCVGGLRRRRNTIEKCPTQTSATTIHCGESGGREQDVTVVTRPGLGPRNTMLTSLLTLQCLLWLLPCLARPYLDQANISPGQFLFDDQVRANWCSDYCPHRLQLQVQDGDTQMFPQYQLLQIITPDILSGLENQLKKASGRKEGEEDTDTNATK